MKNYQELLRTILNNGETESQRAVLSDGSEVLTKVLYSQRISFDLEEGFPLVTVKKTSFKVVKEELKWFLRGENNVKSLQERGVNIWNEWADANGDLGGSYPGCWRDFGGTSLRIYGVSYDHGCDQIKQLENQFRLIKAMGLNDVTVRKWKRRLLLTGWDPNIVDNRGPVGCHTLAQWHPSSREKLHCDLYMRSVDCFLGLPYNIACYALLTSLWAGISGLRVGMLNITMGNCHLYSNHLDGVATVLDREPMPRSQLMVTMNGGVDNWDASLDGYQSHPSVKGEIAI